MRRLLMALAAGLVMAGALGGSAWAGDATCVWKSLPKVTRDTIEAKFPDLPGNMGLPENSTLVGKCGVTAATQAGAGNAVEAYALRAGSAARLKREHGVDDARMMAAWKGLSEAERQVFIYSGNHLDEPAGDDDTAVILKMATAVGLASDKDAFMLVAYWLTGLVQQQRYEKEF